jgi:uncharacterized membrane protein YbhN (UPF0104 family)
MINLLKKINFKIFNVIFSIIVIALTGYYVFDQWGVISNVIADFDLSILLFAVLLYMAQVFLNGVTQKEMFQAMGYNVGLFDISLLSFYSSLINYVVPMRGGAVYRAIYMKNKYNINLADFISTFLGSYVLVFWINSVLALGMIAYFYITTQSINWLLTGLFTGLFVLSLMLSSEVFIEFLRKLPIIPKKLMKVADGWLILRKQPTLVVKILLLLMGINAVSILEIHYILAGVAEVSSLVGTSFLSISSFFAAFVNITPGSLGLTEGLMAIASSVTTYEITEVVNAQLIRRTLELGVLVITGITSFFYLQKYLDKKAT